MSSNDLNVAGSRRHFLGAAGMTALSQSRVQGANETVRIGGIGTGGRCQYLLRVLSQRSDARVVAVSDVYAPRREEARQKIAPDAREFPEYRRLLEEKDIDAVVIGSPDHWHVPMLLDALSAGKDVYVEKPLTRSLEEHDPVRKAMAGSKQVVQVGYQQRSTDVFLAGRDIVRSGRLGKVALILAYWYQNYLNRSPRDVDTSKLDWKSWLGTAPDRPFDVNRFSSWRWYWDYGGGALTDLFSHWIDSIHWFMNRDTPLAVQAMGDRYGLPHFECPDTINGSWMYPGFTVVYNGTLVGSLDGGGFVLRGSEAMMKISRSGLAVYPEKVVAAERTDYPEPVMTVRAIGDGTVAHLANFVDCVKTRRQPNSNVEDALASARAAHLGNIALRKGARVTG